jgi:hypothetical protein
MEFHARRGIVRERESEEQLRLLLPDFEEADDFTLGAEFILSENPESRPARFAKRDHLVFADGRGRGTANLPVLYV